MVLAHGLLGFVVPPVQDGSASPGWWGFVGPLRPFAVVAGKRTSARVTGAGWARRCEAGGL